MATCLFRIGPRLSHHANCLHELMSHAIRKISRLRAPKTQKIKNKERQKITKQQQEENEILALAQLRKMKCRPHDFVCAVVYYQKFMLVHLQERWLHVFASLVNTSTVTGHCMIQHSSESVIK